MSALLSASEVAVALAAGLARWGYAVQQPLVASGAAPALFDAGLPYDELTDGESANEAWQPSLLILTGSRGERTSRPAR
jgi:hypothetical protein